MQEDSEEIVVKDSNGHILQSGDAVMPVKDLNVKGANMTIKRGTKIKNIRLTDNPEEIECSINGTRGIVLKTCFIKKA